MKRCKIALMMGMLSILAVGCTTVVPTDEPTSRPPTNGPGDNTSAPATPDSGDSAIGTATTITDVVELGHSNTTLQPVTGTEDLFAGDFLRIQQGGRSLLDFGDLSFTLFNDSAMDVVTAERGPEGSIERLAFFLEQGGVLGELNPGGGEVSFRTPTGADITVTGTQFMIAYESSSQMLMVGNFGGDIQWETEQGVANVPDGMYMVAYGQAQPSDPAPLTWSYDEFARQGVEQGSLQDAAVASMTSNWELLIAWDQNWQANRGNYGPFLEQATYSQQVRIDAALQVGGAEISGAGGGFIAETALCPHQVSALSTFRVEITGQQVTSRSGDPVLSLEVQIGDLTSDYNYGSEDPYCAFDDEGRQFIARTLQDYIASVQIPMQHGRWVSYNVPHPLTGVESPLYVMVRAGGDQAAAQPDETQPLIYRATHVGSWNTAFGDEGCGIPRSFQVEASIADVGIVESVTLYWRYTDISADNPGGKYFTDWLAVGMTSQGGDRYAASINNNDYPLADWLNQAYFGTVEYYVAASDRAGYSSETAPQSIPLERCVIIE